jgi:hypothetical protein
MVWFHDGESEQRPHIGILSLKFHNRIWGSLAALAKLLNVRGVYDLERRVSRKCLQSRNFGTARPADTPRSLKHPGSELTVSADALTYVIVPAGTDEAGELLSRRLIVSSCGNYGGA